MGKRLVGVIKFHFQFLCFSYAELWYSCACVFEMFECSAQLLVARVLKSGLALAVEVEDLVQESHQR